MNPSETMWNQMSKRVQVELSGTKWVQVKTFRNQGNPNETKWVQVELSETEQVQVKQNQTKWNQMGLR